MNPLLAGSLISGGVSAGQGILGMIQNTQNRKFAQRQAWQARHWAIEDWHRNNEYNSPRAQMQRLQEAGLNPNLVYGQGVQGASGNASPVRTTEPARWQGQTPDFSGLQNSIFAYQDLRAKTAQADLLEKQNTIAIQEAALRAAKTGETLAKAAKSKFDLQLAQDLRNNSLQMADANLQRLQIGNKFQLDENERRQALTAGNLAQAAERILLMRAQTANTQEQREEIRARIRSIRLDGDLKQLDKDLREQGIYPNSPWWIKTLETYMNKETTGRPFGGDLDWIPQRPTSKEPGEKGFPMNAKPQNWYKWK